MKWAQPPLARLFCLLYSTVRAGKDQQPISLQQQVLKKQYLYTKQDYIKSNSRITRATLRPFMSLSYHLPTPASIGFVHSSDWIKGSVISQKKCVFHTVRGKKTTKMISCFFHPFPIVNLPICNFTSIRTRHFPCLLSTTHSQLHSTVQEELL